MDKDRYRGLGSYGSMQAVRITVVNMLDRWTDRQRDTGMDRGVASQAETCGERFGEREVDRQMARGRQGGGEV